MGEPPYADLHPMKVSLHLTGLPLADRELILRSCSSFPKTHRLNLTIQNSPEHFKTSSDSVFSGIQEL